MKPSKYTTSSIFDSLAGAVMTEGDRLTCRCTQCGGAVPPPTSPGTRRCPCGESGAVYDATRIGSGQIVSRRDFGAAEHRVERKTRAMEDAA